ncbi:MAG: hypothetical protein SNJ57_09300 [Cyanobacteriota bacterium]
MRHDLSLFLCDFCEAAGIEVKRETWRKLEYRIKPIYGQPGWNFWLWCSPDFTAVQLYGIAPNDEEFSTDPLTAPRSKETGIH